MCGISLIINTNKKHVDELEIKKMNDLIVHRGPDDEGFYFGKNFAFGHRRLSILDLSSDGHQPMHFLDKYIIIFNGEIYNYLEIKEELVIEGYKFHSLTDTEVILASYDMWGEECVNKFNGMWSFAIYDKEKEIIFCSRDRFGVKPCYYTEVDGRFILGSEIKQLLEFYKRRLVNQKILMDYLVIGYEDHTNETFFENIYKLEQSHNLVYDLKSNTFSIKRYYDIVHNNSELNEKESIELYKNKLTNAVKLRLRSDVKVGTCLSGGLDSSSIAGIASILHKEESNEKFIGIHAKSSDKQSDESSFAEKVAESLGLDLRIVEPLSEEFIQSIDDVVFTQEEPFGSPSIFMQYFVMKKSKEVGCTVLLDGQGGDETLLGYERYYSAYLISLGLLDMLKGLINSSKNSKMSIFQLIQYFIYFTRSKIRLRHLKKKNYFVKHSYFSLLNKGMLELNSKYYSDIFKLQYMDIYQTQMPHLLRYEDKNSMRHSVESRLPFIDYTVLETALSINNKFKIKNGWTKYVLRKSIENILPQGIVWRKNKFGFEAPTKSWLSLIEEQMKKSIKNSKILNTITNEIVFDKLDEIQKWRFFNVSKWEEVYKVTI